MIASARRLPHISPGRLRLLRAMLRVLQAVSPRLAARVAFRLFLTPVRRKLNPADEAEMYRARVHFLTCANGDKVRVYEWGEGARTALIMHGWGSHAARMSVLANALAARGWRVLVPDAPGHGESGGNTSSLPQFIGTLDAVITQLGPVQALIGHSLGALAVAMRLGDAAASTPAGLTHVVLISMPSGAPYLIESFEEMFDIRPATRRHGLALFERRFASLPDRYTASAGAARITVPTLLVHDAADDIVPHAHSEELRAAVTGARLHVTQGLGHSGLLRDPETLRVIGDFID